MHLLAELFAPQQAVMSLQPFLRGRLALLCRTGDTPVICCITPEPPQPQAGGATLSAWAMRCIPTATCLRCLLIHHAALSIHPGLSDGKAVTPV